MTESIETVEPVGVKRLREARERLAEIQQQDASPATEAASARLPVAPADVIWAKKTGVTFSTGTGFLSSGHVTTAGESIVITSAIIDASYDRHGHSWLAHLVSDDAQIAAWGELRFGLGPAPEDAPTWNRRGDADWVEQRSAAKAAAWSEPNPDARAAALAAVEQRFGPQVTTATYTKVNDPSIAKAEAQQHALNTGGLKFAQHVIAREAGEPEDRR